MRAIRILVLCVAPAAAWAQTATVQNAATYQAPATGFEFASFLLGSPASIITLQGSLATFQLAAPDSNVISPGMLAVLSYSVSDAPLHNVRPLRPAPRTPVTLSIRPVGSLQAIAVSTIRSVSAGAIEFAVPSNVPAGYAELLYKVGNEPTQWTTVHVVESAFALYGTGQGGRARAQVIAADKTSRIVGLTTPAQPGQTIQLAGSGLGNATVTGATIGGVNAAVLYAGPDPSLAGRDLIQLRIPGGVSDGCYVPLELRLSHTTLATTISVTTDGVPCSHPWQLSVADMQALDDGGALADGLITLSSDLTAITSSIVSEQEHAGISAGSINADQIALYMASPPSTNGCSGATGTPTFAFRLFPAFAISGPAAPPDIGSSVVLENATTSIALQQSNGYQTSLQAPPDGTVANPPASVLAASKWTWQSTGGKDLATSSFSFVTPPRVQLNAPAPLTLKRGQDQTILWNGGAFDAGATAVVSVTAAGVSPVTCNGPAGSGSVTIPAALLASFAPNSLGTLTISVSQTGASIPHAEFQLKDGRSLLMLVLAASSDERPIAFQ